MKEFFLTVVAFLTTCCSPHQHVYQVDASVKQYVEEFYSEAASRGLLLEHDDLIVELVPASEVSAIGEDFIGVCQTGSNETPFVRISSYEWNYKLGDDPPAEDAWHVEYREYNKRLLVFHELGHCLLHRGHRTDLTTEIDVNDPSGHFHRSVMYPVAVTLSPDWYVSNWTAYLDELFGKGDGPQ